MAGIPDGNNYQVIYHIPIPSASNKVGMSYQNALIASGIGGTTILKDGDGTGGTISAAEKADIQAGKIYEVVQQQTANPGQTVGDLAAILNANYTALANITGPFLSGLANQLSYFGGKSAT
jgi:hypothetical protein